MGFGPVSIASTGTLDIQAPGAPGVSISQTNNTKLAYGIVPSSTDADGSPLTGQTFIDAVVIEADAATAEQFRNDFDGALAFNGAQPFTHDVDSALTPIAGVANLPNVGSAYSILARAADHARG